MRLIAIVMSLVAAARAQQLLVYGDNALPTCAQQCTVLQSAQTGCIPPAAPVTNDVTYESCFCQSGYLTALKSSGSTLCSDVCTSSSDVAQIATWFQSNCADNGVAAAAKLSTTSSTASTTATSTSAATAAASTTSSSSSQGTAALGQGAHHTWWTDHWKWIVMLIVIFVGLGIIAVALVLLRRRYHRRQDVATQPFNSGITHHSLPVLSVTSPSQSNQTSRTSLPKVREKDRFNVDAAAVPPVPSVPRGMRERGGTPDLELEQARLRKQRQ